MNSASPSSSLSPRHLLAAPHRLLFFAGASNVLLAMTWWAAWLVHARWAPQQLGETVLFPGFGHALVMQYQVLPPFIFGFLLTVFPRWMGLPELRRAAWWPVGAGLGLGQLFTLAGLVMASKTLLLTGFALTLAGWLYGVFQLGRLLLAERAAGKGPTWHACSCFAGLLFGLAGLLLLLWQLAGGSGSGIFAAIKLGSFGLLLPVYFSVAHRMFPFFAGNVVAGYTPWRPLWLLAVFWPLVLAHLALELAHAMRWLWLADIPLALLAAFILWRWWPRAKAPVLLWVLFIGFAWLPVAFALYAGQSLVLWLDDEMLLGRGPLHALVIGFFGSLLVAMVTRVTQGHSGRPLAMPATGLWAFALVQLVALLRVLAEALPDPAMWQALAALGWLVAFLPWALRSAAIYLKPRKDGKPG